VSGFSRTVVEADFSRPAAVMPAYDRRLRMPGNRAPTRCPSATALT